MDGKTQPIKCVAEAHTLGVRSRSLDSQTCKSMYRHCIYIGEMWGNTIFFKECRRDRSLTYIDELGLDHQLRCDKFRHDICWISNI